MSEPTKKRTLDYFFNPLPKKARVSDETITDQNHRILESVPVSRKTNDCHVF